MMTWLDSLTLDTVVVHVQDGPSLKGIKSAVHEDCLVLRDFMVLDGDTNTMTLLQGEVVIPRERVLFLQLVAPST